MQKAKVKSKPSEGKRQELAGYKLYNIINFNTETQPKSKAL